MIVAVLLLASRYTIQADGQTESVGYLGGFPPKLFCCLHSLVYREGGVLATWIFFLFVLVSSVISPSSSRHDTLDHSDGGKSSSCAFAVSGLR